MIRKLLFILTVLVIAAGLTFAGGAAEEEIEDVALDELDTELDVWLTRDDYRIDLDEWEQMYPNIRINYEVVPWEETLDQLVLTAGTPQAPDISVVDQPWIPIVAGAGHLLPLDDLIDETFDPGELDDFADAIWEFVSYEGHTYAMPLATFGRALYYRSDWFAEEGLDEPETWEDVIEAGQIFHNPAANRFGLTVRGARDDGTAQGWLPIFYAMGGEFDNEDVPVIDSQAGVQALQLYQDMVWDYQIMSQDTVAFGSGEARGLFISGNAAMSIIGSHIAPAVVNEGGLEYDESFRMTHIPRPERGMDPVNVNTSFQWAVLSNADHPRAAMEFLKYVSSTDAQLQFNIDYMEAVRASVYDIPEYEQAKPWTDFIAADQVGMRPLPRLPQYNQVSDAIQDALQTMLADRNADARAVAAEAQDRIDEAVGR